MNEISIPQRIISRDKMYFLICIVLRTITFSGLRLVEFSRQQM